MNAHTNDVTKNDEPATSHDARDPSRGRSGLRVKSGLRAGADKQTYLKVKLENAFISSY